MFIRKVLVVLVLIALLVGGFPAQTIQAQDPDRREEVQECLRLVSTLAVELMVWQAVPLLVEDGMISQRSAIIVQELVWGFVEVTVLELRDANCIAFEKLINA